MREMGFSHHDYRMSQAIDGHPLNPDIVPKLKAWLGKNGFPW